MLGFRRLVALGVSFSMIRTSQVRHGMMLVGPTGGGKTCCYRTLQAWRWDLNEFKLAIDDYHDLPLQFFAEIFV